MVNLLSHICVSALAPPLFGFSGDPWLTDGGPRRNPVLRRSRLPVAPALLGPRPPVSKPTVTLSLSRAGSPWSPASGPPPCPWDAAGPTWVTQADPPSKPLAQPHPHSPSHEPGVSTGSGWGHGHLSGATVLSTMRVTSRCPLTGTWPSAAVLERGAARGDSASSRRHGGASGKGPRGTAQAPDMHPQNTRAHGGAPHGPHPSLGSPDPGHQSQPAVPALGPAVKSLASTGREPGHMGAPASPTRPAAP